MISLRDLITEKRDIIPDEEVKERSWVLVFRYSPSLQILLAKDDEGKWSFPGGQLNDEETAEEAAWRELKEETALSPEKIEFLKTIYHDKPNKLKVSHVFYTEVPKDVTLKAHSDVEKLKWFSVDDIPALDVSKPKRESIEAAVEKLHDPKKELKECISEGLERGFPLEFLTEGKRRKTTNGFLIVFEGIDGAGKTTQRKVLKTWLEGKGWKVTSSKWSASPHISELIKVGKQQKWLTPALYSLLHASDMVWRYENEIKPALQRGHVVLCDRYYYTSYARDLLRGVKKEMLDEIYRNFVEPDMVIHFTVPPRLAVERLMKDKGFKWYSSGMDIGYNENMEESASVYETNMDAIYRTMLPQVKGYKAVDAQRSIREIFEEIKGYIHTRVKALERGKLTESTSFYGVLKRLLTERMSFRQLLQGSESGRKQRGRQDVRPQSMKVTAMDGREAWTFNYKSNPSTTGQRWHGYVQFFKEDVQAKDNAMQLDCMVDCDCPDYRFRYAYNNAQADVGRIGASPEGWPYANQNNGQKPRPRSQGGVGDYGVGLCKHLCSLSEHLRTVVEPVAPEPDEPPMPTVQKKPIPSPTPPAQKPQTTTAPDPDDDTYTDSRTGSDTLTEGVSVLYDRLANFVKSNPEFEVMYDGEDED